MTEREQQLDTALRKISDCRAVGWLKWMADAFEAARPMWKNHADDLRTLEAAINEAEELIPDIDQ